MCSTLYCHFKRILIILLNWLILPALPFYLVFSVGFKISFRFIKKCLTCVSIYCVAQGYCPLSVASITSSIPPFCHLSSFLLITPSHQGNGKLDFDFYLWMAVPDTRAVSQDIILDKCAFSLIYCLRVYIIWLTFVL